MEHLTTHLHRPRITRSPLSFWAGKKRWQREAKARLRQCHDSKAKKMIV
ncbi:hypothetical protein CK203_081998 [Vitis vinifera]|uniref:Uncharacterized protein n=1 Tax=Vitis vinifera TaxID=29760 RepID=A0A438BWI1_VITVI|nr:hypothetical protein CK203_081998 [Vitis vinifera]